MLGESGAPDRTDLEPIPDVLEEWAEQIKHFDIEELLGAEDNSEQASSPELGEDGSGPPDRALTTGPGPEPGGPV